MKIIFNSDDNLPLNKPLKCHLMTVTIRSVLEEDRDLTLNKKKIAIKITKRN